MDRTLSFIAIWGALVAFVLLAIVCLWALPSLREARRRLDALESGLACGPESKGLDDIRTLNDRVTTFGVQLAKFPLLVQHEELADRVARLEKGLESLEPCVGVTALDFAGLKARVEMLEKIR